MKILKVLLQVFLNWKLVILINKFYHLDDKCANVNCKPNERCESNSGECKCGFGETCANSPWEPTCVYIHGTDTYVCECGDSQASCNKETERCNEYNGVCMEGTF